MMYNLRKILLLSLLLFFELETFSQITYIRGKQVLLVDYNESYADRDSLLEWFVLVAQQSQRLKIMDEYGEETLHSDSLLSKIERYINIFISKYTKNEENEIDVSKRKMFLPVYEKLRSLKEQEIDKRDSKEIEKIFSFINGLDESKEKVWMQLKYLDLLLPLRTNPSDVTRLCLKAQESADQIENLFDKGFAYMYIGDYARDHQIKEFAISLYYQAKEFYYNSSKGEEEKNYIQGVLSEKIAKLFEFTGGISGEKKRSDYYYSAYTYFGESKSQDKAIIEEANVNYGKHLILLASLLRNPDYLRFDSILRLKKEAYIIKSLNYALTTILNHGNTHEHWSSYVIYEAIGIILETNNRNEEAKVFYLLSVLAAFHGNDADAVISVLEELPIIYAKLGKEQLSIKYADILIFMAEKLDDRLAYYNSLLDKANAFFILKKYDSTLVYSNKMFRRIRTRSLFDFISFLAIQQTAFGITSNAFSALKSDSVWYYRSSYSEYFNKHLNEFESLVETESILAKTWMERVKLNELDRERKISEKEHSKNVKLFISLGILVVVILIGLLFIYRANKKKRQKALELKKEEERKRVAAEKEIYYGRLNLLIELGKKHEVRQLIEQIASISETKLRHINNSVELNATDVKNDIREIIDFSRAVSDYVNEYYESSKNLISYIDNEIKMARAYLKVFEIEKGLYSGIIKITNNIQDDFVLNKLPIPSHLLNNFIMNSIKHGTLAEDFSKLDITITSKKTRNGYILEVDDNGCGIDFAKSATADKERESSGFEWVRKLLDIYNYNSNDYIIRFNKFSVHDKSNEFNGEKGTKVSIEIIKK